MKLKQLCSAAILTAFVAGASATSAWAVVDNSIVGNADCSGACGVGSGIAVNRTVSQINAMDNTGTSFNDLWNFTTTENGRLSGKLFANNNIGGFQITGLTLLLQTSGGTPIDPPGSISVPVAPPNGAVLEAAFNYAFLTAGSYRFAISGTVPNGQAFGQYQVQGSISAVPLPAALWLFLTALTGLAAVARVGRRKVSAS